MERVPTVSGTTNLIDILDRVLDKGLVVAGDIRVSLANVELLTIRIRLLICSVDKAEQIGLNWWKYDPNLTQQVAPPVSRFGLPPSSRLRQKTVRKTTVRKKVQTAPLSQKSKRTSKKKTAVKSKRTRQR